MKIKQYLLYAMLEKSQYDKVMPLVSGENSTALKLASIVQILYFGASYISSLGVAALSDKKLVYGMGTVIPLVILCLHLLLTEKHPAVQPWLVRIFCVGILMTGLLCTLVCTPDEMTILLLVFFFCVPMLFVLTPVEQISFALITDIIYFAAAPTLKTPDVLSIDMIDIAIFSTLSVILGVSTARGRFRRYWLETQALDLAEVRYRAAFIDQLTETYNRNAYNKDTEHMKTASVPDNFMFVALDINGLKAANDSMGHVAGDELIIGTAKCLRNSFDKYGKVYRVGGDEFIIILETKNETPGDILDAFNTAVKEWHGDLVRSMSVSYGVVMGAEARQHTLHEVELLADKRMYQSKSDYYKNSGLERRKN